MGPTVNMLKVSDLRKLAVVAPEAMQLEVGPMALVQRPPEQLLKRAALAQAAAVTVPASPKLASHALSLMLGFGEMVVIPIGAASSAGVWKVGRGDDCEVKVQDPSTSLHHAQLRWDAWKRTAWICDLGSTNGTFLNGARLGSDEAQLTEGDTLSLGNAAFLFVQVETLHAMLRARG